MALLCVHDQKRSSGNLGGQIKFVVGRGVKGPFINIALEMCSDEFSLKHDLAYKLKEFVQNYQI